MGTKREAGDVSFALGDVKPGGNPGPPQPFRAEAMLPGAEVVQVSSIHSECLQFCSERVGGWGLGGGGSLQKCC